MENEVEARFADVASEDPKEPNEEYIDQTNIENSVSDNHLLEKGKRDENDAIKFIESRGALAIIAAAKKAANKKSRRLKNLRKD